MWGMTIMMVTLVIIIFFFCMLPVYRLLQKRWKHWDQIENDPRWNVDHFQFSPTPTQIQRDIGYNRLRTQTTPQENIMRMSRDNHGLPRYPVLQSGNAFGAVFCFQDF